MDSSADKNKSYSTFQEEELKIGKNLGLDITKYENPDFLAIQMQQIRMGLQKNLQVDLYANPDFDWFQMEEIRKGLERNVDAASYADPKLHYEKMRQLRKGLEVGIDMSEYLGYNAGIMRQIRKSILAKVDILSYVKDGYDEEQLDQIRISLENGIDISKHLRHEYRGVAIQEIRLGLEKSLDVDVYEDIRYNWRQMRELRLGMENRILYTTYANPLYSWRQMFQIRTGLQDGIDVSSFSSLMYPSWIMKVMREKITLPDTTKIEKAHVSAEDYQLTISDNAMEAYLTMAPNDSVRSINEIEEILKSNNVTMGYEHEVISAIAEGRHIGEPVLVAQGKVPHVGKDGWYEYFFRTNLNHRPKVLENGDVDYQDIEWFELVQKDRKLAYYHESEEGEDGFTVTGKIMKGKRGQNQPMLVGEGFVLGDDKKTYYAAFDGMVSIDGLQLVVLKEIEVHEVTTSTGNVIFDGSVHVKGKVGDGAIIKATNDIMIDDFVGAAMIECGGKVVLKKGINADHKGYVKAGKGGVVSRFFENVRIESEGDIEAKYCLNSDLHAIGKVHIIDTLSGGKTYTESGIEAYDVGNKAGIPTKLFLGINPMLKSRKIELEKKITETETQLITLKKTHKEMMRKLSPEVRNRMELFIKLEEAVYSVNKKAEALYDQRRTLDKEIAKVRQAKILIRGNAYEGIDAEAGGQHWKASGQRDITVHLRSDNTMEVYTN